LLWFIRQRVQPLEEKRQAEVARQKHIAEMKALATREMQIWQQVDAIIEKGRKIASVYDEATVLLEKLKQLSEFQDT
jgi:ribulose bisphosphate carboxylase small subunit